MPGMAKPIMFDDMPTKRPHFFFLIAGRKYFALRNCASKFVAIVFRHVGRSSSSIERFGKYPALFTTISTPRRSRLLRFLKRGSAHYLIRSTTTVSGISEIRLCGAAGFAGVYSQGGALGMLPNSGPTKAAPRERIRPFKRSSTVTNRGLRLSSPTAAAFAPEPHFPTHRAKTHLNLTQFRIRTRAGDPKVYCIFPGRKQWLDSMYR